MGYGIILNNLVQEVKGLREEVIENTGSAVSTQRGTSLKNERGAVITADTEWTLPNEVTYPVGKNLLEINIDGLKYIKGTNYEEVGTANSTSSKVIFLTDVAVDVDIEVLVKNTVQSNTVLKFGLDAQGNPTFEGVLLGTTYTSAGAVELPEYTKDEVNGTITIGTGIYNLCVDNAFLGRINQYTVEGGTFTIPDDGAEHGIIVDYNNGTPVMRLDGDWNDSSAIWIYTLSYTTLTNKIGVTSWGTEGLGLPNKLNVKSYTVGSGFSLVSGLNVATENTREIVISPGVVFVGTNKQEKAVLHSATDTCLLIASEGSGVVTQYNSTVYDDGSGTLKTITDGSYGVVFVYRGMSDLSQMDILYGTVGTNNLEQAKVTPLPANIPVALLENAMYLGRLIYLKGADSADFYADSTTGNAGSSGTTSHDGLLDVLGGKHHSDQSIMKQDDVEFASLTTAKLLPKTDGTTALQITKADGTTVIFNIDTTNTITTFNLGSIDNAAVKFASAGSSNMRFIEVGTSGVTLQGTDQSGNQTHNLRSYGANYLRNATGIGKEPVSKFDVQGTTSDGSTNIINLFDSGGTSVFAVDTDGKVKDLIAETSFKLNDSSDNILTINSIAFLIDKDNYPVTVGEDADYSFGYDSTKDAFIIADGADLTIAPRFTIKNNGFVGIGTTPNEILEITDPNSSSAWVRINGGTNAGIKLVDGAESDIWLYKSGGGAFRIATTVDGGTTLLNRLQIEATYSALKSPNSNQYLSVYDTETISKNLIRPATNNTDDVGTATYKFKDGYFAGKMYIDGYTKLGSDAPAIKVKKLTFTAASQGSSVTVTTGLTFSKILGFDMLIITGSGNKVPPSFGDTGTESCYRVYVNSSGNVNVTTPTGATQIAGGAGSVTIIYEE